MQCPKCGYQNEYNVIICGLCKEILIHKEDISAKKESLPKDVTLRTIFIIILGVVIGIGIKIFCFERIYIISASMEPTLKVGDKFWVNKIVYLFNVPKRNEIVLFKSPEEDIEEVKRIIAVENDKIEIINKEVYINSKKLNESYIKHTRGNEFLKDDNFGPFIIPKGYVFVLGDNRDESKDSRNWESPFLPVKNIRGRLML